MITKLIKAAGRRFGIEITSRRPLPYYDTCVSLSTDKPVRGRCLIAYILAPFLDESAGKDTGHTHFAESILIAGTWLDQGFDVDVIDYRNAGFLPDKHYDYFVSARKHLAEVAARLNPDCVKIAHLDTAQFAHNNASAYRRLLDLQQRRGQTLPESLRIIEHNLGIDAADFGVLLGNATTRSTYEYAGKPLYELNVPAAVEFSWDETKKFDNCRNRFLWIGSSGLLHKGLDLAIEAFVGMPEMELVICGPVSREPRFMDCYARELADCDNISVVGWIDVGSEDFLELVATCIGVVYPSCGEGQAGSVVTCIRAGLIPLVSRETGLDVEDFGELLAQSTVSEIERAVKHVAALSAEELASRARRSWERGNKDHTPDAYRQRYGEIVTSILSI